MKSTLSKNLAILIPRIGTDQEVADRLDVYQSTVWRWRNGSNEPNDERLAQLVALTRDMPFAISMADLRYGDLTPLDADQTAATSSVAASNDAKV